MKRLWNTVAPLVLGALLAFAVWQGALNAEQGKAICTLRHDLEARVASSEKFLHQHPKGILGIPAATIRKGISDQRRTIAALAGVSCGGLLP